MNPFFLSNESFNISHDCFQDSSPLYSGCNFCWCYCLFCRCQWIHYLDWSSPGRSLIILIINTNLTAKASNLKKKFSKIQKASVFSQNKFKRNIFKHLIHRTHILKSHGRIILIFTIIYWVKPNGFRKIVYYVFLP